MAKDTATHKALARTSKNGDLVIIDTPTPKPGVGEILIKVHATGLNPGDWKTYKFWEASSYPAILGFDIAGEVVQIGDGVQRFEIGDRVLAQVDGLENRFTAFQQYAVKNAAVTVKIPDHLSYDEASTIPAVINTAIAGLFAGFPHGAGLLPPFTPEGRNKYKDEPIVIIGGAGSVGQAIIQVAKMSGFSPVITTASEGHTAYLKSLGATHVISRHLDAAAVKSAVQAVVGNKPIKTVYDAISLKETIHLGESLVAQDGVLIVVVGDIGIELEKTAVKTANVEVGFISAAPIAELLSTAWREHVYDWLNDGRIKSNKVEVLPNGLKGIPDGLKRLENGQVSATKLVAHPQETV